MQLLIGNVGANFKVVIASMLSSAKMQAIATTVAPRSSSLDTDEAIFKDKFTLVY